ncbi:helix-turn-helix domain-containing protein [Azospirillum sp. SYSU D00513]|uniref:helix-turn-helix domain-containing protein n=1 Tax=Azospirillum sp. SYSU D00513 TaxID=2812561 RepID=UPI001A972FC6|nr:helix-turn-helix domain-containing protein [Azospirillum sp. SYSU D00513]
MPKGIRKATLTDGEAASPSAVDVHVGGRIRLRRTLMGITQTQLAVSVGLTFQQVQKYEKGWNRVSASKLWQFSKALDVPISFFFDNLSPDGQTVVAPSSPHESRPEDYDLLYKRETLELAKAYHKIVSPEARRAMFDMFKAVANSMDRANTGDA